MKLRAELTCYHCGQSAGQIEGPADAMHEAVFRATSARGAAQARPWRAALVAHCPRCGGPTYVEAFERVRDRRPLVYEREHKRGRPPRPMPISA